MAAPEIFNSTGRIMRASGGLFLVRLDRDGLPLSGETVKFRARGGLRGSGPVAGDRVAVSYTEASVSGNLGTGDSAGLPGGAVESVLERKNSLIRPQMANLDRLFLIIASASPDPSTLMTDKLLAACEYKNIEPCVIIGKCELEPRSAALLRDTYEKAGYPVFVLSCRTGEGVGALKDYLRSVPDGSLCAFSGASGVGKTTLLNTLFPGISLSEGEVSRKTGRGRHTTRVAELFEFSPGENSIFIADTPGFSMIDFEKFDFLPFEALPDCMREFRAVYPDCRWADCTHTGEKDCGVLAAVKDGRIAASRRESYLEMYASLKKRADETFGKR